VNPSQITGGAFEVDTEYQAGVSYSLGTRIRLSMTGRDRQTSVHGDIPAVLAATTLTDARSKSVDASAEYRLNKRVSFVLTARHEKRDANNAALAYDDDGVGLSIAVRF
jgi:predicted porin